MREIKFRGKRFDNNHNDWIYGYLHVIDTCGEGYTGKAIQQQCGTSRPYSVQVHRESIGQFTGLYDDLGIEIYEGDIAEVVDGKRTHQSEVFIHPVGVYIKAHPFIEEITGKGIELLNDYSDYGCGRGITQKCIVIGNKYEEQLVTA